MKAKKESKLQNGLIPSMGLNKCPPSEVTAILADGKPVTSLEAHHALNGGPYSWLQYHPPVGGHGPPEMGQGGHSLGSVLGPIGPLQGTGGSTINNNNNNSISSSSNSNRIGHHLLPPLPLGSIGSAVANVSPDDPDDDDDDEDDDL